MTKRVVDDAMVERAIAAHCCRNPECIRKLLEAALTEPEEIPVTEEMVRAGEEAGYPAYATKFVVSRIYRAMETVRRKSEKPLRFQEHRRAGDDPMGQSHLHRRAGDHR